MRPGGRLKLGFYPLPVKTAERLKCFLSFPNQPFSAIDPCVGNGVAFSCLLQSEKARQYGIELDGNRAMEAGSLGIVVRHADALEIRCGAAASLLYLNPPYDFEIGPSGTNKRMEFVFLKHTLRWLKPGGVLVFVIPQSRLKECARALAAHFTRISVFKLTEPECVRFNQIVVLAHRHKSGHVATAPLVSEATQRLEQVSVDSALTPLPDIVPTRYEVPCSDALSLRHEGIPLDEVEDLLLQSGAYRQLSLAVLHQRDRVQGRPVTPLHGGHVGLLCTAGLLDGVFGSGDERHIANWKSIKYVDHWENDDEDGGHEVHDCERLSQELTLLYANGNTDILSHEKKKKASC